jgi:hypothetical protein
VLDEYISQVKEAEIDYDKTVFNMVLSFLREKYESKAMSVRDITDLMYQFAVMAERELVNPWQAMYITGDYYELAENGCFDKEIFDREFNAFVLYGVCPSDFQILTLKPKKESFFAKLLRKIIRK